MAAGKDFTLGIKSGAVYAWGRNDDGQLGDETYIHRSSPVKVDGLAARAVHIAAGGRHGVAVLDDGSVWTWGENNHGQLGDGTRTRRNWANVVAGIGGVVAVSAGTFHTVVLKNDGTVWAWGENSSGQLGDGSSTSRLVPTQVVGLNAIVALTTGDDHSMALRADGTVWGWGANSSGQVDPTASGSLLTAIMIADLNNVAAIEAGSRHTLAIKSDGSLWGWGDLNLEGSDNSRNRITNLRATEMDTPAAGQIAAGSKHVLALKADGTVWSWGDNLDLQLGYAPSERQSWKPAPIPLLTDVAVVSAYGTRNIAVETGGRVVRVWGEDQPVTLVKDAWVWGGVRSVAAGGSHYLALTGIGTVVAWGANNHGQLGSSSPIAGAFHRVVTNSSPSVPLDRVKHVVAGRLHSLALRDDGTVWSWGYNASGQLGIGSTYSSSSARLLPGISGVTQIDAYGDTSVALASDGTVWVWGENSNGELGTGNLSDQKIPAKVEGIDQIVAIADGGFRLALDSTGKVYGWGINGSGVLGETETYVTSPVLLFDHPSAVGISAGPLMAAVWLDDGSVHVWGDPLGYGTGPPAATSAPRQVLGLKNVRDVAAGRSSGAVHENGSVSAWGDNGYGQLGDGSMVKRYSPRQLESFTTVRGVAHTESHFVYADADGFVWASGQNYYGQLGDGTTIDRHRPVRAQNLDRIVQVSAGVSHSLALREDGTVWAWGGNTYGQLGDNTTSNRSIPFQVSGLAEIVLVTAGFDRSFAVSSTGQLYAWGSNAAGTLGDGTTTTRRVPVLVGGIETVIGAGSGFGHTAALRSDGTVWTWGLYSGGKLGGNATANRLMPGPVTELLGIKQIAVGRDHTLALDDEGDVWAFGENSYGTIGDGTKIDKYLAVQLEGLPKITRVAAGWTHSLAVTESGYVLGWGHNNNGALGIGRRSGPAAIRLVASENDSDQDGMIDDWEISNFGTIVTTGTGDADEDGLADIVEYALGSNPNQNDTDADLLWDAADAYPSDFFDGEIPVVAVIDGDGQVGESGQPNAQPFDIAVWTQSASDPMSDAPLVFEVLTGGGALSESNSGRAPYVNPLVLLTDEDGSAQAFYRQPEAVGVRSEITAIAGPSGVLLETISVPANPDIDGDGLPDSWESRTFGHTGVEPGDDFDGDGLTNAEEFALGTNPKVADTDGDGMLDGAEVASGGNPLDGLNLPANLNLILRLPGAGYWGVNSATWTIHRVADPGQ